jgi:hypothetical protein
MDTAQLSLVRQPFDHSDFLFELKHDGFRALAHVWDGNCELVSRKRNVYKSFQELKDNLGKVFAPTSGEAFTHQELSEISECVKKLAFSRVGRRRRAVESLPRRARAS